MKVTLEDIHPVGLICAQNHIIKSTILTLTKRDYIGIRSILQLILKQILHAYINQRQQISVSHGKV